MKARRPGPGRPPVPDEQIIDGARRALIENPRASMSDIARTAGVGMSALYARFPGRTHLLRHFADEANARYRAALDEVAVRLDHGWTSRRVLQEFMTEIALADVHQLGLLTFGTFERSTADHERSRELRDDAESLVRRCHDDRVLRPGVAWFDLFKAQEVIACIAGETPEATRNLRLRMLDVLLNGFTRGHRPVPGSPPTAADLAENRTVPPPRPRTPPRP